MLDKAKLVGEELSQCKNDYRSGRVFYSLILAPKTKYSSIIGKFVIVQERKTFKGFNDSRKFLGRSQYFNMLDG